MTHSLTCCCRLGDISSDGHTPPLRPEKKKKTYITKPAQRYLTTPTQTPTRSRSWRNQTRSGEKKSTASGAYLWPNHAVSSSCVPCTPRDRPMTKHASTGMQRCLKPVANPCSRHPKQTPSPPECAWLRWHGWLAREWYPPQPRANPKPTWSSSK